MKRTAYAGSFARIRMDRRFRSPATIFEEDPLKNTLFPQSPKKPKPPPEVPNANDEAVQRAKDEERRRRKAKSGRRSTILTSQLGDLTEPNLEKKELLGS